MKLRFKLTVIFIVFSVLATVGIIYLNKVFLPTKIKSLIIQGLSEATGKDVSLDSVQFSIFKGLVIRNLNISDAGNSLISLKEGSCTFLVFPVFKKIVILPTVALKSPVINLTRRKDGSLNILDIIRKDTQPKPKSKFNIFVYKVSLRDAVIKFRDETFDVPFTKELQDLDINLYLSLPAKVKFSLVLQVPASPLIRLRALGEYRIPENQLDSQVVLQDFSPREFLPYYRNSGLTFPLGSIDGQINLKFRDNVVSAGIFLQSKGLAIVKKQFTTLLNAKITASSWHNFKDKTFDFSGKTDVTDCSYSGLKFVGPIRAITGQIALDKSGISSQALSANIWGLPLVAKGGLTDFSNLLFEVSLTSDIGMPLTQQLLMDKLRFTVPGVLKGGAKLFLTVQNKVPTPGDITTVGYLDISSATADFSALPGQLANIYGRLIYDGKRLMWPKLKFDFSGKTYATKGSASEFKNPVIQLELDSDDLQLASDFAVNGKTLKISQFSGRYFNSDFAITGNIDSGHSPAMEADISGSLDVELKDLFQLPSKFKDALSKVTPSGRVHTQFNLIGNLKDLKSCELQTKLSGTGLSLFGFKVDNLAAGLNQSNGVTELPLVHLSLYDGRIDVTARADLSLSPSSFWVDADIQEISLEKLKMDTPFKDAQISGIFSTQFKANGSFTDLAGISGSGKASITEGKLWELNLFKGIGSLLLVKDFAKIIFHTGTCDFLLQDHFFSTDNLVLRSNIVDLFGPVKLGLSDDSVDVSLQVNVLDEMVPLTGTFKDVTTAIVGQAGTFGVIKITGTRKEPKYKFKPAVGNIFKGITDTIFGKPKD
ncbi:MAG: hypothetical protein NTZ92_02955 [Candidatus Omnitrophica bacterium]|nr:hypothetical protein [Candidatus Omnitrophota bacterium]